MHIVIANSIIERNNLLYDEAYVVKEKLGKMKKSKNNEKQKDSWWKRKI